VTVAGSALTLGSRCPGSGGVHRLWVYPEEASNLEPGKTSAPPSRTKEEAGDHSLPGEQGKVAEVTTGGSSSLVGPGRRKGHTGK